MPFTVQPQGMVVGDQMACLQGIQHAWENRLKTKRLPEPPPIPIRGGLFYVLRSKKCLCDPAPEWCERVVLRRAEVNANRSTLLAFICFPDMKP